MSKYGVKLKVLSPLHVASVSDSLLPMEYFIDNGLLCLTTEDKLIKGLKARCLLYDFLSYIEQEQRPSLQGYIDRLPNHRKRPFIHDIAIRKIKSSFNDPLPNFKTNFADPMQCWNKSIR